MSNYIYTTDGELHHADELYHYGVPGMKWGKRKAQKYVNAARVSNAKATEWEIKQRNAEQKGRKLRAAQYAENARNERNKANTLTLKSKGLYSKRSNKLKDKADTAKESAKEWDELSKIARDKGKLARSEKFAQYAKKDRQDASHYEQKAKRIIDNRLKRRKIVGDISSKSIDAGKNAIDRIKTARKRKKSK